MNHKPHAFLFDIDGTLIRAGGAGKQAFVEAWRAVFDVPHGFDAFAFAGCTDPAIFAAGAREALGRDATPAETEAFFDAYLRGLPGIIDGSDRYHVLPGMVEVLEALATRDDCLLGLCTGNLEPGARIKLRRGDLNRFFTFGGYGSDSSNRAELTAAAWHRAEELAGGPVDAWVIGDSTRDYAAAAANGLKSVLVATGGNDLATLAALKPDLLFESFADWETVLARLLGLGDGLRTGVDDVARAAGIVRSGGVIAYPTSTLYGLGGDALDPACARRIRRIKGARDAPFLLLAADPEAAFALAADVPRAARVLAGAFWPGPLTLVLPARAGLPSEVTGPGDTVAVRVDAHPFCRALCAALGGPILSTSANRTGRPAPARVEDFDPAVVAACDLLVQDPAPLAGAPSTLVRATGGDVEVLRPGALSEPAIRAALDAAPGGAP